MMPEKVFRLAELHDRGLQDAARRAWDQGNTITIDASEIEEQWRIEIERWLISQGIVYQRLILNRG